MVGMKRVYYRGYVDVRADEDDMEELALQELRDGNFSNLEFDEWEDIEDDYRRDYEWDEYQEEKEDWLRAR